MADTEGWDFNSSYPYCLLAFKYPAEAFIALDDPTIDIDYEFIKKYTDEFRTIYNCYYKNIRKVASSNDECKKKMVKRFSESIFKESNDEKEL